MSGTGLARRRPAAAAVCSASLAHWPSEILMVESSSTITVTLGLLRAGLFLGLRDLAGVMGLLTKLSLWNGDNGL